jgi:dTDP-4-dehydrorhamnose reductase
MQNRKKILVVGPTSEIARSFISKFGSQINTEIRVISIKGEINPTQLINQKIDFYKPDSILYFPFANPCSDSKDQSLASVINLTTPISIAEKSKKYGYQFIVFSTTRVFEEKLPFASKDTAMKPNSVYGEVKAKMEEALSSSNASILRLTKVLTPNSPLFQNWKKAINGECDAFVYKNRFISPIFLNEVTDAIFKLINLNEQANVFQLSRDSEYSYENLFYRFYSIQEKIQPKNLSLTKIKFTNTDESHSSLKRCNLFDESIGDFEVNFSDLVLNL